MEYELKEICKRFINIKIDVKDNFKWQNKEVQNICSFLFFNLDASINSDKLSNSKKLFKENVGIFSNLNGNFRNQIISLMSLSSNPEQKVQQILSMYKSLKKFFPGSQYLVLASALLVDEIESQNYNELFSRAKSIYTAMKSKHRFITAKEDVVMCLLLALSSKSEEEIINETEEVYITLKKQFKEANARQSLSHILTLQDSNIEATCNKVSNLFNSLKENKIKYGTSYELQTLGLITCNSLSVEQIVSDFIEVDSYLKELKEYSKVSVPNKVRYTHVCILLAKYYGVNNTTSSTIISSSILTMLLLQQAMYYSMSATIVATSAC